MDDLGGKESSIELNKRGDLEKIKHYLSQRLFDEALDLFKGTFLENEAIIILGKLNDLKRREKEGLLSLVEYSREENRILSITLILIKDFEGGERHSGLYKRGFERRREHHSPFSKGNNYLLAIGIDNYKNHPQIRNLNNAVKDTKEVVNILINHYGFGIVEDSLHCLYNQKATADAIIDTLEKKLIPKIQEVDNLLVYVACHGHYKQDLKMGYLIPHDGDLGKVRSFIRHNEFKDYLQRIQARHIFLIADTCFSGDLLRSVNFDDVSTPDYLKRIYKKPSRMGLASGDIEAVLDGLREDHSPFAKALINFLKNPPHETFSAGELITYVSKVTANNAEQTPLYGRIFKTGDELGQMVFQFKS